MGIQDKHGYCTLCRSRCGTVNSVEGDTLVKVRPDGAHPTGKAMCMKGRAAPELVHSSVRIQYPMRRTRHKGAADPGWVRISWEEALAETAGKLAACRAESGAESVVFGVTTPSGTPLSDSIDWIERFVWLYGSPNICYGTEICNWHKDCAHAFTFGCGMPTADYQNAELILLWGHNPASTWLSQANAIGEGRAKGARMIVVDPRQTPLAREADVWLRVRPGTDGALAMGIAHLLIKDGTFDDAFVRNWTNGPFLVRNDTGMFLRECDISPHAENRRYLVWDHRRNAPLPYDAEAHANERDSEWYALRGCYSAIVADSSDSQLQTIACEPAFEKLAQAVGAYTPERVSSITGIDAVDVRAAAVLIGQSRRIAYHAWSGVAQHTNATQTERAIAVLYALTGSFDTVGGNRVFSKQPVNQVSSYELLAPRQRRKALGLSERPLGPPAQGWVTARDTYRAVLEGEPYRVRALIAFGTNMLASQADTRMAQEALCALEFHVHCDLFETPSARFADILLPINTPWEREGLRVGFEISESAEELVQLRQRMVSPRGESRSDNDIVFDLACRLGMGSDFFNGMLEAGWNYILSPLGLDVATLRDHPEGIHKPLPQRERKYAEKDEAGVKGFATETRRVELYSERLLRHEYAPLPAYAEPADSPVNGARGPRRYPYVLSSAKNGYYCHSQHRSLPSLRKRALFPRVEISASLAAEKGIRDGDWARIETRIGSARFRARVSDALSHEVIVAEHGWWQACTGLGQPGFPVSGELTSNYNALVSADHADPISGATPLRSFMCDVSLDPVVDSSRRPWQSFRDFRVKALRPEAEGVRTIVLEADDGGALPDYQPGQHARIRIPSIDGAGMVARTYSLTGQCEVANRRTYSIAVRHQRGMASDGRAFEGSMSGYLHRALRVGDSISLEAPGGAFVMPIESSQPVVLLAGGIGITPFISYLESLRNKADMPEVWLHYANRNSATHAFRARIRVLQKILPKLHVINYYSAPLGADLRGRDFDSRGRVSAQAVSQSLIDRRARFYLCGPEPMMLTLIDGLATRGVPAFDVFKEVFRSPIVPVADAGQRYTVEFSRSGLRSTWTPEYGSLLAFGEKLGVQVANGCRVGQCESCLIRIVSGNVCHLNGSEPEEAELCLACQAIPTSELVIDA